MARRARLETRVCAAECWVEAPQGHPSGVSGMAPLNSGGRASRRRGNRSSVSPWVPRPLLTPASAASDQFWLLRRISSTDQGRSHTGSDAGGRSESGLVRFICSEEEKKR